MSDLKDSEKPFGPVEKDEWTVTVDKEKCIGAGICTAIATKTFEMDNEGKALILRGIDEENKDAILDSAKACPVAAIIIKTKDATAVYPE